MKKLNKKGFTLIELLAVIVILAIIVVVTVPTILNSINDARKSTINSLSKEVANWYDTSYAQDLIAIDDKTILGTATIPVANKWYCLSEIKDASGKSLADKYQLSDADVNVTTQADGSTDVDKLNGKENITIGKNVCSAIRLNGTSRAEVLIVGKETGKFGARYSYSTDSEGKDLS